MEKQGYISAAQYAQRRPRGLGLHPSQRYTRVREPYVFDQVRQELVHRYGLDTVRRGGLQVYTTIQPRLQAAAQRRGRRVRGLLRGRAGVGAGVGRPLHRRRSSRSPPAQRYSGTRQFNFATQAHRQPGSSFKTFVLATAIKQGIDPDSTYYDGSSPMTLTIPGGIPWTVHNAEPGSGTMSVAQRRGTRSTSSTRSSRSTSAYRTSPGRPTNGDHLAARHNADGRRAGAARTASSRRPPRSAGSTGA